METPNAESPPKTKHIEWAMLAVVAIGVWHQGRQTETAYEQLRGDQKAREDDRIERAKNEGQRVLDQIEAEHHRLEEARKADEQRAEDLRLAHLPYVAIPNQRAFIPLEMRNGTFRITDSEQWANPRFIVNYGLGPAIGVKVHWVVDAFTAADGKSRAFAGCEPAEVAPVNLLSEESARLIRLPCFLDGLDPNQASELSGSVRITWSDVRGGMPQSTYQPFTLTFMKVDNGRRTLAVFDFGLPTVNAEPVSLKPYPRVEGVPAPAPPEG